MLSDLLSYFAGLFSVVNPLGAMPSFISWTQEETHKARVKIAVKACAFFAIILLISYWFGLVVMDFFGITIVAMRIAGGLIILSSGWNLLKGDFSKGRAIDRKVKKEAIDKEDISLTPLAIPMLSGPGSISFLLNLKNSSKDLSTSLLITSAILLTAVITCLILILAPRFVRFLGRSGIKSLTRIMGFIVMSIGIQYLIGGISSLYLQVVGN